MVEPIIQPELAIVDPHHHLWVLPEAALAMIEQSTSAMTRGLAPVFRSRARYLLDELLADLRTGHNVRATVFVEVHAMYRASGPPAMRSLGEVEFANGMAAMAASGVFGEVRACAGIVGSVDLTAGAMVEDILGAHLQAGGERYRGVRCPRVAYDEDESILGTAAGVPRLLRQDGFRSGFKRLERLGLSFDAWLLEPQLPDLIDLARAFPGTQIILNHTGGPLGVGRYTGRLQERFPIWRANIGALSRCENVAVKLGGLGMPVCGFKRHSATAAASSEQLAQAWRPYIESCIEAFGARRCMFESNFPIDAATCDYVTLWNTFKRVVSGASSEEKAALFSGTAARLYRLDA